MIDDDSLRVFLDKMTVPMLAVRREFETDVREGVGTGFRLKVIGAKSKSQGSSVGEHVYGLGELDSAYDIIWSSIVLSGFEHVRLVIAISDGIGVFTKPEGQGLAAEIMQPTPELVKELELASMLGDHDVCTMLSMAVFIEIGVVGVVFMPYEMSVTDDGETSIRWLAPFALPGSVCDVPGQVGDAIMDAIRFVNGGDGR